METEEPERSTVSLAKRSLPTGTWCSTQWPADDATNGQAVVLWDLDQGSWNPTRMACWLNSIGVLAQHELGCDECAFVGCLNERAAGRAHWHSVLHALHAPQTESTPDDWCVRRSKLVVVPCRKQAVDEQLMAIGRAMIEREGAHRPRAMVLITHDSDFVPLLTSARRHGVRTLLVRWRTPTSGKNQLLEDSADASVLVDKETGRGVDRS